MRRRRHGAKGRTQAFDASLGFPGEGPADVPLQGRGAEAWRRVATAGMPAGRAEGGVNLLHVHSVQDATAVDAYLPEVSAFLRESRSRGWRLDTMAERDAALADMIAILCYSKNAGIQRGRNLLSGFLYVYPEHSGYLPEADRALKAWERFQTCGERDPICEEAWAALTVAALRGEDEQGALINGLSLDCLLRGQDWSRLRLSDVKESETRSGSLEVALRLGVRARGERTKTGAGQGVVVERPWLAAWLRDYCDRRRAQGKIFVFDLKTYEFRSRFATWQGRLRIAVGTPHVLRHGGAALMISRGDERKKVKVRGRWGKDKSLDRYTKTHLLTAQRATLPQDVLALGRAFLADPIAELIRARQKLLAPRDG